LLYLACYFILLETILKPKGLEMSGFAELTPGRAQAPAVKNRPRRHVSAYGFGPAEPVNIKTRADERLELNSRFNSMNLQFFQVENLLIKIDVSRTTVAMAPQKQTELS